MKVTPKYIASFETNVQTFVQDAWARTASDLFWDKFMERRTSGTLVELYFWLLETARIYREGQGGNKRYDDMAATFYEIKNENSGAALKLTKNELQDNMMSAKNLKGMPALDYAANWAKQVGGATGYWPQQVLFELIAAAITTGKSYDGEVFFSTAHPINPVDASGGTFSNRIAAKPLGGATTVDQAAANLASVIASMRSVKMPNGAPRRLRPKWLMADPSLQYRVGTILDTKFFNASENVLSRLNIEPIIADELAAEPGVWYLGAEIIPGEGGPFVFQEREAYTLTSYASDSEVELQRRKDFEWLLDGRNAGAYGHPYLVFRVDPT